MPIQSHCSSPVLMIVIYQILLEMSLLACWIEKDKSIIIGFVTHPFLSPSQFFSSHGIHIHSERGGFRF